MESSMTAYVKLKSELFSACSGCTEMHVVFSIQSRYPYIRSWEKESLTTF